MKVTHALQMAVVAVSILTLALPALAAPDCSDARIRRLAQHGRTIAAIAEKCELDEEEVEEVLDAEPEDAGSGSVHEQQGLPSGTPVSQCACYGFVTLGYQQPFARCQSGVVVATMCPGMCPAGGYQWHNVCQ